MTTKVHEKITTVTAHHRVTLPPHTQRTPEEAEALIARLDRNLADRMHGRENVTDAVGSVRRQRTARARALRAR